MLYFDNAATTRPFQEALDAFMNVSLEHFGNPSSRHGAGFDAERLLEGARSSILKTLKMEGSHRLVFTSGASEANNLGLKGAAFSYQNRGKKILLSPIEHPSVLNTVKQLEERFGFEAVYLTVDQDGVVDLKDLEAKMDSSVILVSVMAVNNETGVIEPIDQIAKIVKKYPKAFFHCDATQAMGKLDIPYSSIDLLTFSAHKFGGLKGVGALVYKSTMRLVPLSTGGEQEFGVRAGTNDVAGAKAMEVALKKSFETMKENLLKERELVAYLRKGLEETGEVLIHSPLDASPYVLDFSLLHHKASVVVEALSEREIYVSSVSACSSKGEPHSYVLEAMGKPLRVAENPIRVSLPPSSSKEEIDLFLTTLTNILKEIRPL